MSSKAKISLKSIPALKMEILYCLQIQSDWLIDYLCPSFCSTSWRSKFPKTIPYMRGKLDSGTVNPVLITVTMLQLIENIS